MTKIDLVVEVIKTFRHGGNMKPEEEISREERVYLDAISLMESVDCLTRFEPKIAILEDAIQRFETLNGYKDSEKHIKVAQSRIKKIKTEGTKETYREITMLQKKAKTVLDFMTVISEYERLEDFMDVEQSIAFCRQEISKLEKKEKNKIHRIQLCVLLFILAALWISPLRPYAKGVYHLKQGKYHLAIMNFKSDGHFLNTETMIRKCHYGQACKAYRNNKKSKAFQLCALARGYTPADQMYAAMEVDVLKTMQPSQNHRISFGKKQWICLHQTGTMVTLAAIPSDRKDSLHTYDVKSNIWTKSHLRHWLNSTYLDAVFTKSEKALLQKINHDPAGKKHDYLYLLSDTEYLQYRSYLQGISAFWLRTEGMTKKQMSYVDHSGNVNRDAKIEDRLTTIPVIQVSMDKKAITATPTPIPTAKVK
jgi:hypothetical protein